MNNLRKRVLAYLCMLAMLVGFLPAGSNLAVTGVTATSADGTSSEVSADATSADVYVTIANKGNLAVGTDGTLMANVLVHVTDVDGDKDLTFNDAMILVHDTYCKDGYAASEGSWGYSVNKLWNDESGAFGYFINNSSASSAKDKIQTDDSITAFIYKDTENWGDVCSYFDKTDMDVAEVNEEIALNLSYSSWTGSGAVSDAVLGTVSVSGDAAVFTPFATASGEAVTTDASGDAVVSFDKAGTYVISAQSDSLTLVPPVYVVTVNNYGAKFTKAYNKIVDYELNKAKEDLDTFAASGNIWNVIALARSGSMTQDIKDKFITNMRNTVKEKKGVVDNKTIIALAALGADVENFEGYNLLEALSDLNSVTNYGFTNAAYALIAADTRNYEIPSVSGDGVVQTTRENLIQYLLDAQLPDGGWSWGTAIDPDSTGMVIQALAPYMESNDDVKAAVNKALTELSELQQDNGGYKNADSEWGGVSYPGELNCESTAQVWCALTALNVDITDERFVKDGKSIEDALLSFQLEDGSFAHVLKEDGTGETDYGFATPQAFYTMVSYARMKDGKSSLYDMEDVKIDVPSKVEKPVTPTEVPGNEPTTQQPANTTSQGPSVTTAVSETTEEPAGTVTIKKQKIKSAKSSKKKQITVKFTKMSKISGYQLQFSTSKKFAKKKTITKRIKKTTYTIRKLKSKKTYYIRVCSYKKVGGKTYYGAYSKVKKVRVK